ncbi:MAG: PIN domain-containing protein [candidate division KSB1 bacterium]|nr:PIN domain-containing protein [candidate division KSB1 bacterium]MDZ7400624.1 PIN domain-containing protein [candidate division KSB1 bacterium]
MNKIFIDTVFVIALVSPNDQYHAQAMALSKKYENAPMLITEAVLMEIGNALAKDYKQEAIAIIKAFRSSGDDVIIIEQNSQLFLKGFEMYEKYKDKAWSLVDCISFVVMRENKVTEALTTDDHFKQAGFKILMHK